MKKSQRFIQDYHLQAEIAQALAEDKKSADYFEEIAQSTQAPHTVSLWFRGELQAQLKERNQEECPIPVKDFSNLLKFIDKGVISNKMAKEIFTEMWDKGSSPAQIIQEKSLKQISDDKELRHFVRQILTKYPDQVKAYKEGRTKLFSFFVGQIMKETRGQANPQKLSQILKTQLEEM